MLECGLGSQRTAPCRPPYLDLGCVPCLISTVLLVGSVGSVASPSTAWAAVYECVDAAGKPVLTNRPSQLKNCHLLSGRPDAALTPPEESTPPQASPPPISSDRPSPPPYAPFMPPNEPKDAQGESFGVLPPPNPGASPSPSPPCARGLNPLNPLSTPPCVQPDQSRSQPQGATPALAP